MTREELWATAKKNGISAICAGVSLLLGVGIYFRSDAVPEAEAELAQKSAEAERLALNVKYAEKLKEQLEAIEAANKEIDTRIIRASQMGINTQYFYKLESETGVKLVDFRPMASVPPVKGSKATFAPVGFNLSVQGTWPQVLDFVRSLEGGARYTRVLTTSVSGAASNRKGPVTLALYVELLGLP
jgi:hypothetical protein